MEKRSRFHLVFFLTILNNLFLITSCDLRLPEGEYLCGENNRCPEGWYCREGSVAPGEKRCYSTLDTNSSSSITGRSDASGEADATAVLDNGTRKGDSTVDSAVMNIDAGGATADAVTETEMGGSGVEGSNGGTDSEKASDCESRCDRLCYSCDIDGQLGICAPVPDGVDPNDDCGSCNVCDGESNCRPVDTNEPDPKGICLESDDTDECDENGLCDGEGHCAYKLEEDSNCDDGEYCNGTDTCDESGSCANHSGNPCPSDVECDEQEEGFECLCGEGYEWNGSDCIHLLWTKLFGSSSNDINYGVATDTSGNVYVTGYTHGDMDGNTSLGGADVFVVKYSSAGDKLWTRQLGSTDDDHGNGIATDDNGDVYVTGKTNGNMDGYTNTGGADVFVVKYSSAGDKLWTRQLGSSDGDFGYDDIGNGIATDASGNVYVTGKTDGSMDGNTDLGGEDIIILKYSSAGDKLWTRQFGTSSDGEIGKAIATDADGNVYVTGYIAGSLDGDTFFGADDIFVVKYSGAGAKLWTRQLGTDDNDFGNGIATDASGNVYVMGETDGSMDGNTNAGGDDIFIVKYSSAGAKLWTRQLGTDDNDFGNGIATDASGNVYVTGTTGGSMDGNTQLGERDMFVVKYNSAGDELWIRQHGTDTQDSGDGIATDATGNVYVTGDTFGDMDGNNNAGRYDIFVVKYDSDGNRL